MKSLLPGIFVLILCTAVPARATDEAIDRLIKKLPPPQKFVDTAMTDPLIKQMSTAVKNHNYAIALDLSRRLAQRYPKSLNAQMLHGVVAMNIRSYPEASSAFRSAVALKPDFLWSNVGLAVSEAAQNKMSSGLACFEKIIKIAPKIDVGWFGASLCAEKMGQRQLSLNLARRGAAVVPESGVLWWQLAKEESLSGNRANAAKALNYARIRFKKGSNRAR